MMKTKTKSISVLTSIAVIMGVFVFAHGIPVAQVQGFSSMDILDIEEMSQEADLIVIGNVIESKTIAYDHETYHGVQITQLQIEEVIKGSVDSKSIEIRDFPSDTAVVKNGLRYDILEDPFVAKYKQNDQVLVFLSYDEGNVLGDAYYLWSGTFGSYQIVDENAINKDSDRTQPIQNLKQTIRNSAE